MALDLAETTDYFAALQNSNNDKSLQFNVKLIAVNVADFIVGYKHLFLLLATGKLVNNHTSQGIAV